MQNNDLISREAAIGALTDTNLRRNIDSVCDGDMNRTRRAAQRVIAQLPAVDAAPVVHGRWVKVEDFVWKCSICGNEDCYAYTWGEVKRQDDLFCPHCGAKMDGEEQTCGPDYCEIGGGDDAR